MCNVDCIIESTIGYVSLTFDIFYLLQEPPQITFRKKEKGGINLQCAVPQTELDLELVKVRFILIAF